MKEKTFITITNKQVYKELCDLKAINEEKHDQILKEMNEKHNELLLKLGIYQSKVNTLKMIIEGIGALVMALLGWFIYHLNN